MNNRIKHFRKKVGMSQVKLAEMANTSPQQISHLEQGMRRLTYDWAERLARVLKVHPADLFVESPNASTLPISDSAKHIMAEGVMVLLDHMRRANNATPPLIMHRRFLQAFERCQTKNYTEPQKIRDVFESYLDAE